MFSSEVFFPFCFVSVFTCVLGAAVPDGMLPQSSGRIVGGTKSMISSYPWQVSLQRSGSHFCGGSIYSNQIIITAAHCLQSVSSAAALKVRAGSTNWNSGGDLVSVTAFKCHENFDLGTVVNDIAVVRLTFPLSYSASISNINLANAAPPTGATAYVSGWGTPAYGATKTPTQLQSVQLKIISRAVCSSAHFNYGSRIKPSMICAYAINKDACKGDSGGPLVSAGVLVGVVSWGVECAVTNYPGVYADVSVLHFWIVRTAYTM